MQGDVFENIIVPGMRSKPRKVQVTMHPCSMRQGPTLRERVTIVPLKSSYPTIDSTVWRNHSKIMPLPHLLGEESGYWASDLCEPASLPSIELLLSKRVAALSDDGVLLLQQRLVFFQTRYLPDLEVLYEAAAPNFEERTLEEEWVSAALRDQKEPDSEEISKSVQAFHVWLDATEGAELSRRDRLKDRRDRASIRRELLREVASRFRIA